MRTITYFSYKGGAGRSTLCMNTIPLLATKLNATKENPLILLDLDIDSAGMTYLLDMQDKAYIDGKLTVQDILKDGTNNNINKIAGALFSFLWPVGRKFGMSDDASILFIPAKDGVAIGEGSNYDAIGVRKLQDFVNKCSGSGAAAVVFDSAVGDQITAKMGNKVSDIILCIMRPTEQFRNGTKRYLERYQESTKNKNIILVPNVVPFNNMRIDGAEYPDAAANAIRDEFGKLDRYKNNYYFDLINSKNFGIPMVQSFMWKELILNNKDKTSMEEDERIALDRYNRLTDIICDIDLDEDDDE